MAKAAITLQYLTDIADAIRTKTGVNNITYKPSDMASAIRTISSSGGITPAGTLSISSNGTYNVSSYIAASVNVPTSGGGSSGGITPAGTLTISQSGVTDVTTYEAVNVPAGSLGTPTGSTIKFENNYVVVNPTVVNSAGWISGGEITGTPIPIHASDVTSGSINLTTNGTYDVTTLQEAVVAVPSAGASNFVSSTFTTKTTTASTETITVPYTGSGYPIGLVITILGGAYNSSISPWYSNLTRYAVGQWTAFKSNVTVAPTYSTSGTVNQAVTTWIYKNSTTTSTSYSRSSAMNTVVYNSGNATGSGANCVRIKSNTSFQYITGNNSSSSYGLLAGQKYRYYMIYSL